jgi:hypothetical protein
VSTYLVVEAEENAVAQDGVEEARGCGADENRDVLERLYPCLDELLRIRVTSRLAVYERSQWKIIWKCYCPPTNEREYTEHLQ